MKHIKYIMLVALVALCTTVLASCAPPAPPTPLQLDTPTNVQYGDDEYLTWDVVDNATQYSVTISASDSDKHKKY